MESIFFEGHFISLNEADFLYDNDCLDEDQCIELFQ